MKESLVIESLILLVYFILLYNYISVLNDSSIFMMWTRHRKLRILKKLSLVLHDSQWTMLVLDNAKQCIQSDYLLLFTIYY